MEVEIELEETNLYQGNVKYSEVKHGKYDFLNTEKEAILDIASENYEYAKLIISDVRYIIELEKRKINLWWDEIISIEGFEDGFVFLQKDKDHIALSDDRSSIEKIIKLLETIFGN